MLFLYHKTKKQPAKCRLLLVEMAGFPNRFALWIASVSQKFCAEGLDFRDVRYGPGGSSSSPYKNILSQKGKGCFWLGWRDSDPRDAGVKVLCLTAWRRPNILIVKTPTAFNYGRINFKWGGGWDSNPRSSEPQSDALGQLRYIHHIPAARINQTAFGAP